MERIVKGRGSFLPALRCCSQLSVQRQVLRQSPLGLWGEGPEGWARFSQANIGIKSFRGWRQPQAQMSISVQSEGLFLGGGCSMIFFASSDLTQPLGRYCLTVENMASGGWWLVAILHKHHPPNRSIPDACEGGGYTGRWICFSDLSGSPWELLCCCFLLLYPCPVYFHPVSPHFFFFCNISSNAQVPSTNHGSFLPL